MEITVIRHGETIENQRGICQGQSDGTLNARGREQALALRATITDDQYDLAISSDLQRALDTADIIFGGRVKILSDSRLRERGLYSMQGATLDKSVDYCGHIDGCESIEEMFTRVRELLNELKSKYHDRRVALLSHGVTIRVISSICEGIDIYDTTLVGNCSINKFTYGKDYIY